MTLKTTHAAGEPIKADDMNSTVKAVLQNAHNIFELFLENFFASKITPFLGLFFDGFSDTTKADTTATTLTAGASSGQAILTVASTTGFKVGHNINIFDGTNLDEKVIQSIDSAVQITLTTNLDNTYVSTDDVQRSTVNFDTTNKLIDFAGTDVGDDKKVTYFSKLQSFQTAMASVRLWVVRNIIGGNTHSIDLELSSSQYLSITDAAQTGLDISTDMTMEIWANFETFPVSSGQYIGMAKYTATGNQRQYMFALGNEAGGDVFIRALFSDDGTGPNTINFQSDSSLATLGVGLGEWHHYAVTFDASADAVIMYLDGVVVANSVLGGVFADTIHDGTGDFTIGAQGDVSNFFDGKIDDVRVWDDIRTPTEISENKDRTVNPANEPNLVSNWLLDNNLLDETSNNNTLTNNNSAVFSIDVPYAGTHLNLASGISGGATTLTIAGDQTGGFANGDIIDISTSDNLIRERKTLTATPSFGGGVTTLTFSATVSAFTTADFVERVDLLPEISVVDKDDAESFNTMTHIKSIVDFDNLEVEDEYSFEPSMPNEDVIVKLDLTREDVSLNPEAKRLGVSLNE